MLYFFSYTTVSVYYLCLPCLSSTFVSFFIIVFLLIYLNDLLIHNSYSIFFFNYTPTTVIYTYLHTLSLHDALPIFVIRIAIRRLATSAAWRTRWLRPPGRGRQASPSCCTRAIPGRSPDLPAAFAQIRANNSPNNSPNNS